MSRTHRSHCALQLALVLGAVAGLVPAARAGVTYDYAFRSTDVFGQVIAGGGFGGGHTFSFTSLAAQQACNPLTLSACPVIDVLLITTVPLYEASASVTFDDSNGLGVAGASQWLGEGVAFNGMGEVTQRFGPNGVVLLGCTAGSCSSFGGVVPPPNGPPSLPPGTYNIGTLVWDTSAVFRESYNAVRTEVTSVDGTRGVILANKVDLTGTEVTRGGLLILAPEPGTAGLLGLVLVGLALRRRHRPRARDELGRARGRSGMLR